MFAVRPAPRGTTAGADPRLRRRELNDRRVPASFLPLAATALILVPSVAARASNDPSFGLQWGLARIGAEAAWSRTTGAGIRIGIVDTGIDLNHEDLAGKIVASTSCVGSGGDVAKCQGSAQDDQGHGTHVSGIAAAIKDNGRGVAGVAPDAELVVAKVLGASGTGQGADVIAGIKWVVDHGAKVVNLSLGDPAQVIGALISPNQLAEGVDYAWSRGAIPVVAAGNSNMLGLGLEGLGFGEMNAIVVGATGPDDRPATYSTSTGAAKWAVAAPGGAGVPTKKEGDIYSTYWASGQQNAYAYLAGTSMAAPHVSGALALLLAQGYDQLAAVNRLLDTADAGVGCEANSTTCRGRINVDRATARP
ncbi:MAG: S8 family serine peptidase [Actinomycetota bacterium]|jgi:subtilisin family serine protease